MILLNGKELSDKIKNEVKRIVEEMNSKNQDIHLCVIQVGDDSASSTYVRNKQNACDYCGIKSTTYKLPHDISEDMLIGLIDELNCDSKVNGILVQLPLLDHLDEHTIIQSISPEKDVDGFNNINSGKLSNNEKDAFVPCTPLGVMEMLKHEGIEVAGKHCVVVGRSSIVGKPMAKLLLNADATVTICHSKTKNLSDITKQADILVCTVGKPGFIKADMVKKGAVVIDVGINRVNDKLVGDVDFEEVSKLASYITPVPGGVGPMTIAMLMSNTLKACENN